VNAVVAAVGTAVVVLLLVALARRGRRRQRSRHARRRAARYLAGETAAERLLEDAGWTIIDRQVRHVWEPWLDGEPFATELRCDLVVEQHDRRCIAEVKTGDAAPSLGNAATRRQLLEYQVAYDVDGVLLVDVEADRIHAVDFPLPEPSEAPIVDGAARLRWVIAGFVAGAAVTAAAFLLSGSGTG
jgi:hypothetical protein